MMTVIPATRLRAVTGGKAQPDAYAPPGSPGNCAWLDLAIDARSAATAPRLRKELQERIQERIDNKCPIPTARAALQ